MIIFAFRLGRFEIVAQRETAPALTTISRPGPGEIILDLPGVSLMLTDFRARASAR